MNQIIGTAAFTMAKLLKNKVLIEMNPGE